MCRWYLDTNDCVPGVVQYELVTSPGASHGHYDGHWTVGSTLKMCTPFIWNAIICLFGIDPGNKRLL